MSSPTASRTSLLERGLVLVRGLGAAPPPRRRTATRPSLGPARRLLLALALLALGGAALAHELRPAVVDIGRDGDTVVLALRVNVEAMIADIGIEHDDTDDSPQAAAYDALRALEPDALGDRLDTFLPTLLEALELRTPDGERLTLSLVDATLPPVGDVRVARDSTLRLSGPLPPTAVRTPASGTSTPSPDISPETSRDDLPAAGPASAVTWHWPERFGPAIVRSTVADGPTAFSVYVLAGDTSDPLPLGGAGAAGEAAGDAPSVDGETPGATAFPVSSTFLNYVHVGFVHIIPRGLDHILFVVGLFLFAPRAGPMLAQVTVFTLAHSVTLALASLGHVTVPSSIVEPLIALSIAAVCAENLLGRGLGGARLAVVFGFGLLHGLGFASVLQDVGTPSAFLVSLLAFNIGVELGQLAVVFACFVSVGWWFRDASWYRRVVTVPGSLAVGAVGLWWFAERLLS